MVFLINFNLWRWSCACVGVNNWVILLRAWYKYNHGLFIILLPTRVDQVTARHLPEDSNLQDILYILSDIELYIFPQFCCILPQGQLDFFYMLHSFHVFFQSPSITEHSHCSEQQTHWKQIHKEHQPIIYSHFSIRIAVITHNCTVTLRSAPIRRRKLYTGLHKCPLWEMISYV